MADDGDFGFVGGFGLGGSFDIGGNIRLCAELRPRSARRAPDSRRDAGAPFFGRFQFSRLCFRKDFQNCVEEIVYTPAVLGGDGKHLADSEAVKIIDQARLLLAIDFVHGEKQRPIGFAQEADEFEVGAGEFGASVDDHDDGGGFVERDARLAENF